MRMVEYGTLIQTHNVIQVQGSSCDLGCSYVDLPKVIAYVKQAFPDKPYCVLKNWLWVDSVISATDLHAAPEIQPTFIYASEVIADEAHRPHLGPLVRSSPLLEFHQNCVFITKNTAYILCGRGNRTTVSHDLISAQAV
jgi:hypothetical protein